MKKTYMTPEVEIIHATQMPFLQSISKTDTEKADNSTPLVKEENNAWGNYVDWDEE